MKSWVQQLLVGNIYVTSNPDLDILFFALGSPIYFHIISSLLALAETLLVGNIYVTCKLNSMHGQKNIDKVHSICGYVVGEKKSFWLIIDPYFIFMHVACLSSIIVSLLLMLVNLCRKMWHGMRTTGTIMRANSLHSRKKYILLLSKHGCLNQFCF